MEVQLTDFENAAFTTFVVLLTQALMERGYDAHMPLAAVEANMEQAQKRDAVSSASFALPTHFARCLGAGPCESSTSGEGLSSFSLDELINGKVRRSPHIARRPSPVTPCPCVAVPDG